MNQGRFLVIAVMVGVVQSYVHSPQQNVVSLRQTVAVLMYPSTIYFVSARKKKRMAEYDLSKTIIPYLDRHLAFPLLAHLVETSLFPVEQVQAAQYELAKGTNMVDYAVSLFEQLQPDEEIPQGLSTSGSRV